MFKMFAQPSKYLGSAGSIVRTVREPMPAVNAISCEDTNAFHVLSADVRPRNHDASSKALGNV